MILIRLRCSFSVCALSFLCSPVFFLSHQHSLSLSLGRPSTSCINTHCARNYEHASCLTRFFLFQQTNIKKKNILWEIQTLLKSFTCTLRGLHPSYKGCGRGNISCNWTLNSPPIFSLFCNYLFCLRNNTPFQSLFFLFNPRGDSRFCSYSWPGGHCQTVKNRADVAYGIMT